MITIRIVDNVEGKIIQRSIENVSVAISLLVSLFARPEFDPWATVYPVEGEKPDDIMINSHTMVDEAGDVFVLVERGLRSHDADDEPTGPLPS